MTFFKVFFVDQKSKMATTIEQSLTQGLMGRWLHFFSSYKQL